MIRRYWNAYGGTSAVMHSPYFHVAIIITLLMSNSWLNAGWWETVTAVIPNLTGFTLGGFAIIVTFGNDEFKNIIYKTDKTEEHSIIATIGATFVHFVTLQILSILLALYSKSTFFVLPDNRCIIAVMDRMNIDVDKLIVISRSIVWFVSYGVFIYALVTAIAATLAIFRLMYNYQTYINSNEDE